MCPFEVVSILPHEAVLPPEAKNACFFMGRSGLDRIDDFPKFCGSGLDRIQLLRIRIGLGLKNSQSAHLWFTCHEHEENWKNSV